MGRSRHTRKQLSKTGEEYSPIVAEGVHHVCNGGKFCEGCHVVIVGLQGSDKYNGTSGTVLAIESSVERVAVQICGGTGEFSTLRVRPENLRCIDQALEYSARSFDLVDLKIIPQLHDTSYSKSIEFVTRLDANACFCSRARPWEIPHSANEAVSIELKDSAGDTIRTICTQLVGQSRVAFGVAFYQSYSHFAVMYDDTKREKAPFIYVDLESWGNGKGMVMVLHNRKNQPDVAELSLISAGMKFLPLFWRTLRSTAHPPPPWLVPLGFGPLEQSYDVQPEMSLHLAAARVVFRYPPVAVPIPRAEHSAASIMRNAPVSCQSLHPSSCLSLDHVIRYHRTWLAKHGGDGTHEVVTCKLALAYALSECRNEAFHREAIDLCLEAVAAEPTGEDPNGARGMLLDFALAAGDYQAVLQGLSTFSKWHDPNVLWTSVLMWFCAHGATSKHTRRALNKAVTPAPDVFPFLIEDEMMPEKEGANGYRNSPCSIHAKAGALPQFGGSSSAVYVENFRMHWQEAVGAMSFLQEYGRPAYVAAKKGDVLDGVSFPETVDSRRSSDHEFRNSMRELQRCMRVNVPSSKKVMCAFCRKLDHLKKCSGCLTVSYCSPAGQSKHWRSGHKQACKAA